MNMTEITLPMQFESEVLEETDTHYIMSLPQAVQDFLKEKKAKYIYVRFLDTQEGHP